MAGRYHVFETTKRDPSKPTRRANVQSLTRVKADQFARIGARTGKHNRVVTLSPTAKVWKAPTFYYKAGTGEKVYF